MCRSKVLKMLVLLISKHRRHLQLVLTVVCSWFFLFVCFLEKVEFIWEIAEIYLFFSIYTFSFWFSEVVIFKSNINLDCMTFLPFPKWYLLLKYIKTIPVFPTALKIRWSSPPLLYQSLTWKYFGPLHHAHHLLSGQAVETRQQVVSGVRLRVVITRVHLFGLNQLQNTADGGRQKRCDRPRPVWHKGTGGTCIQLLFGGQISAADAACGCVSVFRARQVVADCLQLAQLLGLPCWWKHKQPSPIG